MAKHGMVGGAASGLFDLVEFSVKRGAMETIKKVLQAKNAQGHTPLDEFTKQDPHSSHTYVNHVVRVTGLTTEQLLS